MAALDLEPLESAKLDLEPVEPKPQSVGSMLDTEMERRTQNQAIEGLQATQQMLAFSPAGVLAAASAGEAQDKRDKAEALATMPQLSQAPKRGVWESVRRMFSGVTGPTESQKFEEAVPFGKNPDGSTRYEYKPLGDKPTKEGLLPAVMDTAMYATSPDTLGRILKLRSQGKDTSPDAVAEDRQKDYLQPSAGDTKVDAALKAYHNTMFDLATALENPAMMAGGGRVVNGYFTAQMAKGAIDKTKEALNAKTEQGKIQGAMGAVVDAAMAALGVKHLAGGKPTAEHISEHIESVPDELLKEAKDSPGIRENEPDLHKSVTEELQRREQEPPLNPEVIKAYHGSPSEVENLSAGATSEGAVWLAKDKAEAGIFSGDKGVVKEVELSPKNALVASSEIEQSVNSKQFDEKAPWSSDPELQAARQQGRLKVSDLNKAFFKWAKDQGHDSVYFPESKRWAVMDDSVIQKENKANGSSAASAESELSQSLAGMEPTETPLGSKLRMETAQAQKMGISAPLPDLVKAGIDAVSRVAKEASSIPKFTQFKEAINGWVGRTQKSGLEIGKMQSELERVIPGKDRREAITNWIQADGDAAVLDSRAKATTNERLKRGYEAAKNLTPEEIKVAKSIQKFYADKLAEAQAHGIVGAGLENYVNQVWKRPFVGPATPFVGKLASGFKFGKKRTFESFFEGEQAGHTPATKDISKLAASYIHEMNKTISTRQLIKDLTTKTAEDGRPLAAPTGVASVVEGAAKDAPDTVFIKPGAKSSDYSDYKTIPNPALSKWKWVHADEKGGPTLLQGQLALHPEIYAHVKSVLGRSAIREWYDKPSGPLKTLFKGAVKAVDRGQGVIKATMLDLSPFHIVQEGTHAIGHKVNPFFDLPKVDVANKEHLDAMNHGLMLRGDHVSAENFVDGVSGSGSLLQRIPYVGEHIKAAGDWVFNAYIPALKIKTYDHVLQRNMERYKDDLASGKVTKDDVKYLSATQTNAAYGHLNYADIGRDPTIQHILRSIMLAPDFLEARTRFTGQSLKPGKSGAEQRAAMVTLATTFYLGARILNKVLDDDWHFDEPFAVKHSGRTYTMRNVPEDIYRMFKDSRRFIYGRLSPILGSGVIQYLTGTNYRGEKVSWTDTTKDLATRAVPLALRSAPGFKAINPTAKNNPVTAWEQFLSAVGIQVSRNSSITDAYQLAKKWKESNGVKEDTGSYPVSKYQQLRYALEDNDPDRAKEEYQALLKESNPAAIAKGFKQSMTRPFTASSQTEGKFKRSLSAKDKATVDLAEATRKDILRKFSQVRGGK